MQKIYMMDGVNARIFWWAFVYIIEFLAGMERRRCQEDHNRIMQKIVPDSFHQLSRLVDWFWKQFLMIDQLSLTVIIISCVGTNSHPCMLTVETMRANCQQMIHEVLSHLDYSRNWQHLSCIQGSAFWMPAEIDMKYLHRLQSGRWVNKKQIPTFTTNVHHLIVFYPC